VELGGFQLHVGRASLVVHAPAEGSLLDGSDAFLFAVEVEFLGVESILGLDDQVSVVNVVEVSLTSESID
jgi:hypothetical protein